MRWKRNKVLANESLRGLLAERQDIDFEYRRVRAYYDSFRLCGYSFDKDRPWMKHWCRKATCPACSKNWSERLACTFLNKCSGYDKAKFHMVTIMFDLEHSVAQCFDSYSQFRLKLQRSIGKARETKRDSVLVQQWRDMSIAGCLEIGLFYKSDFDRLGSRKQASYIDETNFDVESWTGENVFSPHFHGIVYLGDLPIESFVKRLNVFCSSVHIQPLSTDQTLSEAAEGIIGYSVKPCFDITLQGNIKMEWRLPESTEYIDCLLGKQGRKAHKMHISSKE